MTLTRRHALAAAAALLGLPAGAQPTSGADVPPPEVVAALPSAVLQGRGTLRMLLFHIYDARLWRGKQVVGTDFADTPLALEITYARHISGNDLVKTTLEQLRLQTDLDETTTGRWQQQLRPLFPTVQQGDRLTAVNEPGRGLQVFMNDRPTGRLTDARLARLFLGIWLSPQTSQPALRLALLGPAAPAR